MNVRRAITFSWSLRKVLSLLALLQLSGFLPLRAQTKTSIPTGFDRVAAQASQARDANDLESALQLYRKALGMRPRWAEGWWSLGTILYDQDHFAEAARAFSKVVHLDSQHGSARVMLGLCEFELGQDVNALRDIEAGKRLGVLQDPQLRQVMLYHEGVLLLRQGSFEEAQKALDSLGQEGVQSEPLVLALGMAALRLRPEGLPPEGSTAREIVLRAGKAESLAGSKDFEAARAEYNKLVSEFPDTANIHYACGRFLLRMHEIDPAVVEFQREIQSNPQHVLAHLEIAAVRYRVDSAAGLPYAEEAVKLEPEYPFGHYLLGLLLLDTGDFQRALSELAIARHSFPNEPSIYFALGTAYARAGRKQEAAQARAIFKRLSDRATPQSSDNTYGGRSSSLDPERLSHEAGPHPQP